jgi:hypothetical protein
MINPRDDKPPPKDSIQYILGIAFAAAAVSTLGAKLVDWAVEEIKAKYGTKQAPTEKLP